MIYSKFFELVLSRFDAESVHRFTAAAVRLVTRVPALERLLRRLLAPRDPVLRVRALGLDLPSPLGVAAGVDKDATWFEGLGALGFGFVELGTVTARPQPGNERPRIFRLTRERALINRMGFPNAGAEAVAKRLRGRTPRTIAGANIGKTKAVSVEDAGADYAESARLLAPLAGYLVVNVSSPNTPGLRDLQATGRLAALLAEVRKALAAEGVQVPLLIKIAPDLPDEEVDALAEMALELGLDGIVAVNTTIDRGVLRDPGESGEAGGISGAPLKPRALAVLRRLRAKVGDRLVLISVGGIETAEDAWERIEAGATLVQAYTGFVYGGPLWPRRVNRGLARLAREAGAASVQDAVGTAAERQPLTAEQR